MSPEQEVDLFVEWDLYSDRAKKEMIAEYQALHGNNCGWESFLDFLESRIQMIGYWAKIGLK